jgi:hypothetical protein
MPAQCSDCKHWDKDGGVEGLGLGVCHRALPFWEATEWADMDDGSVKRRLLPEFSDRRFFAQDGSDYRATVMTASDFFCADFTPLTAV